MTQYLPPVHQRTAPVHVSELLALPGPEFVECVYQATLGRAPDPAGRDFFRQRLLEGISKLQIAQEFAQSPEAIASGAKLNGLAEASLNSPLPKGWRYRAIRMLGLLGYLDDCQRELNRQQARLDERVEQLCRDLMRVERDSNDFRSRASESQQSIAEKVKIQDEALQASSGDAKALAAGLKQVQENIDLLWIAKRARKVPSGTTARTPLEALAVNQQSSEWHA